MEFADVVRRRRMVRRYAPDPVAPEVVDRMLAHAQRAPSAGFSQGTSVLVLDEPDDVALFWEVTSPSSLVEVRPSRLVPRTSGTAERAAKPSNTWLDGMRTAPAVIVPLACRAAYAERYAQPDKQQDVGQWPVPWWWVDAGMGILLVLQTAVDEGLGACFFGIPGERRSAFADAFGIPDDHEPVGAITIGHRLPDTGSAGSPGRRGRRTNLVHRGRWGTTVTS